MDAGTGSEVQLKGVGGRFLTNWENWSFSEYDILLQCELLLAPADPESINRAQSWSGRGRLSQRRVTTLYMIK